VEEEYGASNGKDAGRHVEGKETLGKNKRRRRGGCKYIRKRGNAICQLYGEEDDS